MLLQLSGGCNPMLWDARIDQSIDSLIQRRLHSPQVSPSPRLPVSPSSFTPGLGAADAVVSLARRLSTKSNAPTGPDGSMLVSDQLYERVAGIETAIKQSLGAPTHLQNFNRDSKLNAAIDESVCGTTT